MLWLVTQVEYPALADFIVELLCLCWLLQNFSILIVYLTPLYCDHQNAIRNFYNDVFYEHIN